MIAGLITFVVPGGPWMSYESAIATMGRVVSNSVWIAALWQAAFALLYGWAVAAAIYSTSTFTGIVLGALMSIPLYLVNYIVVRTGMGAAGNEVHAVIAHFMFCLIFAALYRAMAVAVPRQTAH
jgi:hypothetical protein